MIDEMGSFRIDVEIEKPSHRGERRTISSVLIDTGAELSVFPASIMEALGVERVKRLRFRQADGTVFTRWTGAVTVYAADTLTIDEVVFGEPGDLLLLGSHTLEGLNLRIDPIAKQLIDAGPMTVAAVA